MSLALYEIGGLRWWTEEEIQLRSLFQERVVLKVQQELREMNPAWTFFRIEGPCLSPRTKISQSYSDDDIFVTNHQAGGEFLCLRAETTPSSYVFAEGRKLPCCVWQSGKSFRRETNQGASAAKLRFNEFYQLEFQCIYHENTKADYRTPVMEVVGDEIARFTARPIRQANSDRLPSYSESTIDIEVQDGEKWIEVASCSIRTDFRMDCKVCEIAIGLDRVVSLGN